MPFFAFSVKAGSVGLGGLALGGAKVFIGLGPEGPVTNQGPAIPRRLYFLHGLHEHGSGMATMRSAEDGGHYIPRADGDGRGLPHSWNHKNVRLEVPGGTYIQQSKIVKLQLWSPHGGQGLIYDWEGQMLVSSIGNQDLSFYGAARSLNIKFENNKRLYDWVMIGSESTDI